MQKNEHETSINKMKTHGFQNWVARRTGVSRTTINQIFTGRRQSTPKQAALLEEVFISKGIPLNRWDLLYGYEANKVNPKPLTGYLLQKSDTKES